MAKKFTQEEVAQYFKEHGYTLLSEYVNLRKKVSIKNAKGDIFDVTLENFKLGQRPENKVRKFTQEEVANYFKEHGYTLLSEYVNSGKKVKIRNSKGDEYETRFNDFKRGKRPDNRPVYTYEYVNYYVNKLGYTLLSDIYVNRNSNLTICNSDGDVYETTLNRLMLGRRPENYIRYTKEDIAKEVSPYGYKVKHVNSGHDITLITPSGYIWKTSIYNFRAGKRSPLERTLGRGNSKGELIVANILKSNGIDFLHQHTININGNRHILDFYLPNKNIIIEYDGIQHYKDTKGIYTGKFKEQQLRDADKDNWAKQNNLNMIRIPYTEDTPIKINNYLCKYIELKEYDPAVLYYMPSIPDKGFIETVFSKGVGYSAKYYGVDKSTIADKFKLLTGMTSVEYKRKIYAEYFRNHSMGECTTRFGKGDFCNAFKSYYGMTKTEYLKLQKLKGLA